MSRFPHLLAVIGVALAVAAVWLVATRAHLAARPQLEPVVSVLKANGVVAHVVDGDTIDVTIDGVTEPVRLIGVNTPETVDPRKPVQCFGPEASAHTKGLLPAGSAVRLERDAEARDKYGRLLAYVYRATDGLFVNLELVRDGFGPVLVIAPNVTYETVLREAEANARQNDLGLWHTCGEPGLAATPTTTRGG